jgi:hypothetical protein
MAGANGLLELHVAESAANATDMKILNAPESGRLSKQLLGLLLCLQSLLLTVPFFLLLLLLLLL